MRSMFYVLILVFLFFCVSLHPSLGLYQGNKDLVNLAGEKVCSVRSPAGKSDHSSNINPEQDKLVLKGEDQLNREKQRIHEKNISSIIITVRSLISTKKIVDMTATAYTYTGNPTYTGIYPQIGTIAVDPKVIPLGSRMWVEGYGYGIAQDTGGSIKGNKIDLFMDTKQECLNWGRKKVKVFLIE